MFRLSIPFSGDNQPKLFAFKVDSVFLSFCVKFAEIHNHQDEIDRVDIEILDFFAVVCKDVR